MPGAGRDRSAGSALARGLAHPPPVSLMSAFAVDAFVLLAYFAVIMGIGLSQRAKSGSMEGFALGDRQIAWWAVLASHSRGGDQRGHVFRHAGRGLCAAELHLHPAHHRLPAGARDGERGVHPGLLQAQGGEHLRISRHAVRPAHAKLGFGGVPRHAAAGQRHAAVGADGAAGADLEALRQSGQTTHDAGILAHAARRWWRSRCRRRSTPRSAASAR